MNIKLAIDLMGGDKAPKSTIDGIKKALKVNKNLEFLCFGSQKVIAKAKAELGTGACEFVESSNDITAEDKVNIAIRKKNSSMAMALVASKEGKTHATVSSGNTGALMALSKIYFRSMEGISRPAICTVIPTVKSTAVLLDMGANLETTPQNLLEFSIMGSAFVKCAFGVEKPKVGLVNIGSEETKGTELVQEGYRLLKSSSLAQNFAGFIEGGEFHNGDVNVIVTDGFTGNVIIKTMEGTGKTMKYFLKEYLFGNVLGKLALLIALPCFKKIKAKIDPNKYNGGMFLGLNGIAVKSHGSSNSEGFANAIGVAANLVKSKINEHLAKEILVIAKTDE